MFSCVVYNLLCGVLMLIFPVIFVTACEMKITKEPFYGHRCLSSSHVVVRQTNRVGCHLQCMHMKNCSFMNHNAERDLCEIGVGECESLVSAVGVSVNVYLQSRDDCLYWGCHQEPGRVAFGDTSFNPPALSIVRLWSSQNFLLLPKIP